jgi:hypothetical protein
MNKVFIVPHFVGRPIEKEDAAEFYSHCVGKGWNKLLVELTDKLFILGWTGGLEQVKEKFGTLRFYWVNDVPKPYSDIAEDLVSYYEHLSGWTCEECGEYGKVRGNGWLVTRCDKCWEKIK